MESIITIKYLTNELHVFTSYYADRDLIINNKRYYCFDVISKLNAGSTSDVINYPPMFIYVDYTDYSIYEAVYDSNSDTMSLGDGIEY